MDPQNIRELEKFLNDAVDQSQPDDPPDLEPTAINKSNVMADVVEGDSAPESPAPEPQPRRPQQAVSVEYADLSSEGNASGSGDELLQEVRDMKQLLIDILDFMRVGDD